jgi:hypothetical protein
VQACCRDLDGEYALDIHSAGNRIGSGDTTRTFQVDCPDAENIQSSDLPPLFHLNSYGLPQKEGLDTIAFDVELAVEADRIASPEQKRKLRQVEAGMSWKIILPEP